MSSPTSKHLWAGDWRESELAPVEAPDTAADPPPVQTDPAGQAPRRRRSSRAFAAYGFLATLLAIVGFVVGRDNHSTKSGSAAQAAQARALPATAGAPVTPKAGQTRGAAIYAQASPAVVSIQTGNASGTGFLIDTNGTIVTNAHVVDTAQTVSVQFGDTGDTVTGRVVGTDPSTDVAVLRVNASALPSGVQPLKFADSSKIVVGQNVYAIGNPFGLDRTLTEGVVSAVNRDIQSPNGFEIPQAVQTDAAINPGNSGGPLLDDAGHVIGVNSQIETGGTSNGNVGVGFAVPSNTVRRVVPTLENGESVAHPWLGVSTGDAAGGGAVVQQIVPGSPADTAGLRSGDVVLAANGQSLAGSQALVDAVDSHAPGDRLVLRVRRNGRTTTLSVTLRRRPAQAP